MNNFTIDDFERLLTAIEDELDYKIERVHKYAIDCFMDDLSIFRLIYDDSKNGVIIAFNTVCNGTDCIMLYEWARKHCPNITVTTEYFVDSNGQNHFGQDALAAMEQDREDIILSSISDEKRQAISFDVEGPFTIMSSTPIYPAWDDRAESSYLSFKQSKRLKTQDW